VRAVFFEQPHLKPPPLLAGKPLAQSQSAPTHPSQVGAWVLGALQLRSGFPPRADFEGGGRQRFLFFAKADAAHMVGFYVFQVGAGGCEILL
jgi:hypothetical protein